jgi:sporulation protein YlmC with PRC-barrel domain
MSGSRSLAAFALALALGAATSVVAVDDTWYRTLNTDDLIGKDVTNAVGEEIAEVDGVVVDPKTKDVYAVLSLGGNLGIGAKEVAVPMSELRLGANQALIMSRASRQELESRPAYVEGQYMPLHGSQSLAEVPR